MPRARQAAPTRFGEPDPDRCSVGRTRVPESRQSLDNPSSDIHAARGTFDCSIGFRYGDVVSCVLRLGLEWKQAYEVLRQGEL